MIGEVVPIDLYHKNMWKLDIRIQTILQWLTESDRNDELLIASAFKEIFG